MHSPHASRIKNRLVEAEAAHRATQQRAEADLTAAAERLAGRRAGTRRPSGGGDRRSQRGRDPTGRGRGRTSRGDRAASRCEYARGSRATHSARRESTPSRNQCADDARRAVGCRRDCSRPRRAPADGGGVVADHASRRSPGAVQARRSSGAHHSKGNWVMPLRRSSKPGTIGSWK